MAPTVYLVSGANRGIGLGLVTQLASRLNVVVFAGARNPSTATSLHALETQYPGKVHALKLTSCNEPENSAAIATIKEIADRLNVVIANAGIGNFFGPALETTQEAMLEHYKINVVGTLVLFQAAYPLLKASSDAPKFAIISSIAGSIAAGTPFPTGVLAYGASKAGLNYLAKKLHHEYTRLVSIPLNPGGVATDMAEHVKKAEPVMFADMPLITTDESAKAILALVDAAKREEEGPKLLDNDGSVLSW